jgi:hypothetical protein
LLIAWTLQVGTLKLIHFYYNIQTYFCVKGEVRKAVEEYRRLLADHDRGILPLNNQLLAAIYARLGQLYWRSLGLSCEKGKSNKSVR